MTGDRLAWCVFWENTIDWVPCTGHPMFALVNPQGRLLDIENVFPKLAAARAHYKRAGLGPGFMERFMR
ncbi:hypothetical protein M747DRAFT_300346 [Aspergillus niger ATCC 13496]|uniref:Uncharacterized protein n=1 Tax=Aspergillus niger ATCC 13496 TaxID=1353008 RepID=A0A370BIW0_ASPNG|nr:hypothetical protein M747DRAFT_300346 [Aspergillus niger ATCC 13496]